MTMDYTHIFAVSAAGMDVERRRLDVAAMNLANSQTIAGADGAAYRPQRVVALALQVSAFGDLVGGETGFAPVASVEPTGAPERKSYEPGNPFADAQGYVSYPGVDTATEMLSIMGAMRAYEANVAAMNATRAMALKALDIGGGS
jgi:flagellar basal-body rod protein FlgC